MDSHRFDELTKVLARGRSRRTLFKSLGAAVLSAAGLSRLDEAGATPACRDAGHPCEGNQTCCDGLVCIVSGPGAAHRCTPCPTGQIACGGVCIPACAPLDQCHVAGVCDPAKQACTNPAMADGSSCNDGNACTQTDVCHGGVCTGGNPIVCKPLDQCHVAGTCDPHSGACSNPNAPDGISCNDGSACTTNDVCAAGVCGGSPVKCPAPSVCQDSVVCDPSTGACVVKNKPDGTLCGADNACTHDVCQSGVCAANVPKPAGTACNDHNSCTRTDACDGAGSCAGGNPVTCPPSDSCHAQAVCNTATGVCGPNPLLPGTCFIGGVCYTAGQASPSTACLVCDPNQSQTSFTSGNEGGACDDGNACTTGDVCHGGSCSGTTKICPAPDQCHTPGACDPATGACVYNDLGDGTPCNDGNGCTIGDACQAGVCVSGPGCASPAICAGNACCTPDFSFQTPAAPCCSGISDAIVPNLCEHQPLGGPCTEDRNCGFAIQPACCNGFCRDLSSDPLNCGTCGAPIIAGEICIGGQAVCQLPAGDFCPNPDRCVDLQVDLNNCGACGVPAPVGGVCLFGVPQCTPGFSDQGGVCCASGLTYCGGGTQLGCKDLTVDLNNCGGCGVVVPSGGVCSFGNPTCTPGFDACNGSCVTFSVDPHNCGSCGHDCGHDCLGLQVLCAFGTCDFHC